MSRTYWRIAPAFWSDEKVAAWGDDSRLLALYILTSPHRTLEGLFRLPRGYILADLGWTPERLAEPFAQLLQDGFIEYDERTHVCLIVNALEYQAPNNPNQVTAALNLLEEVPATPLFARLFQQAQRFCQRLAEGLAERFPERLGQPPTPALTLTLPKEDAAALSGAGSSSNSPEATEEPGVDDPVLWELAELPYWASDAQRDRELLALVATEAPGSTPAQVMAEYRVVCMSLTAKGERVSDPPRLYRKIARDISERVGRRGKGPPGPPMDPLKPTPAYEEHPGMPEPTPEDRRTALSGIEKIKQSLAELATGATG